MLETLAYQVDLQQKIPKIYSKFYWAITPTSHAGGPCHVALATGQAHPGRGDWHDRDGPCADARAAVSGHALERLICG